MKIASVRLGVASAGSVEVRRSGKLTAETEEKKKSLMLANFNFQLELVLTDLLSHLHA